MNTLPATYNIESKNSGVTFLLNLVCVGSGHIYLGGKYTNKGVIYLIINIFLALLTFATAGIGFILWFPFGVAILIDGYYKTEKRNKEINLEVQKKNSDEIIERQTTENNYKQNDINSKKVHCIEFIESLEKANKLFKNDLLTEEEYMVKKQKLINNIELFKVADEPEEFLLVIIDLKTKGILTQDDLLKIKKAIL